MAPMYYRGAKTAVAVFDVTKEVAASQIEAWRAELLQYSEPNVAIVVAGNKADMDHPAFNEEECRRLCERLDLPFFLTSAFTGDGVEETFMAAASLAHSRQPEAASSSNKSVRKLEGSKSFLRDPCIT